MALSEGKVCPQLVGYKGSVVKDSKLWIIMEYVGGGSVHDRVQTLSIVAELVLTDAFADQGQTSQRTTHSNHMQRSPVWAEIPVYREPNPQGTYWRRGAGVTYKYSVWNVAGYQSR